MFEIYSEVRATLSANVIAAIDGSILDTIRQCVLTATIEQIISDSTIQYQLYGTLDGILIAKTKLEELLNSLHVKKLSKENTDFDSTTLSEESVADEGNTSNDKDKTSCLSDDKERETNASSNGYMSTNTESSTRTLRPKPLSKKLRLFFKDRPRTSHQRARSSARLLKQKATVRCRPDPEWLSENLQQMKLATEDSDPDSTGTDVVKVPARKPCKARNYEAVSVVKYSCEVCSFRTKRSSHLVKHMAVHEKVLSCQHCSYQTTKKRYYDRHQRLHSSNKRAFLHQCEECTYRTHRKEHYQRHVKTVHSSERPHLCHHCGRTFKRADALSQHRLLHGETDTNYKCTSCSKQFRSQSHLHEHQATHSEFRNFLCEICGASFKTRSVHRKHVQSIHRNPRSYPCDHCSKKFNTQYTLKRHRKTHFAKPKHHGLVVLESNENQSGLGDLSTENQSDVVPQSASECESVAVVRTSAAAVASSSYVQESGVGDCVMAAGVLAQDPKPSTVVFAADTQL